HLFQHKHRARNLTRSLRDDTVVLLAEPTPITGGQELNSYSASYKKCFLERTFCKDWSFKCQSIIINSLFSLGSGRQFFRSLRKYEALVL
ncbi:MAG: hypothetical protein ACREOO_05725, partial [bacterium]